jgi:serine/threonine protein kinase
LVVVVWGIVVDNGHILLDEDDQITITATTPIEENHLPLEELMINVDSVVDRTDHSNQVPETGDTMESSLLSGKLQPRPIFPVNIIDHLCQMLLFRQRFPSIMNSKESDHGRDAGYYDVTMKVTPQQQQQKYTPTPYYVPLKFFDVHRRFAKVGIFISDNNNNDERDDNDDDDETCDDGLVKMMTEPTIDENCYPGMILHVFKRLDDEDDINNNGNNDKRNDNEDGETGLESRTATTSTTATSSSSHATLASTLEGEKEDIPIAKSSVEILERSYTLLEPVQLELGVVPRHFLDFAYNPVLGRANSDPAYINAATSPIATQSIDRKPQLQNTLKDDDNDDNETVLQEQKATNVAITSPEDRFTVISSTFSSWWSWWFPYASSWWKPHGLSRSDFTMGKSPFAGGSHGEVWRGRRVCREGDDAGRSTAFLNSRQKQRLYKHIDGADECDEQQPLVLKRLKINRGYKLLEAGLREVYFGNLIRRQLDESQRNLYTAYVDHFFREVPKRIFGRLQESIDLELWIVFEDAGPSLRSYIYTATMADGFVMYQHSTLWTQLRTMTFEKQKSQRDESNTAGGGIPHIGRKVLRVVLYNVLSAAAILHQKGVVHRDIKPSNIMCDGDTSLKDLFALDKMPTIKCRLGDFSSGWDHYTAEHLYTKGPSPWEQTDEYAPPESYIGPSWIPFSREKPQSYDSWSIGVTILELLLGTPNVFTVDQRTSALLTHKMERAGASEDEISHALYLAALSQFCIYVPSYNVSRPQSWPLGNGDPLHDTAMAKDSCTLQDFHRALRARDPLGIGFDSSTDLLLHLVWQLLAWDPNERMTAEEALQHPYFTNPNETLESLDLIPGYHNALESQMLDPRMDFDIEDSVHKYICPKCRRVFHDWRSCHQHANTRKHAKFCIYDYSKLPTCLNAHSMLPEHPTSGYCDLQGRRPTIEDFHSIHLYPDHQFYGIFDGHSELRSSTFSLYLGLTY